MKKTGNIIVINILVLIFSLIIGIIFNITFFFILFILCFLLVIITSLYEIYQSKNININEKIMWTVGLIFANGLTLILYLLVSRERIIRKPINYYINKKS